MFALFCSLIFSLWGLSPSSSPLRPPSTRPPGPAAQLWLSATCSAPPYIQRGWMVGESFVLIGWARRLHNHIYIISVFSLFKDQWKLRNSACRCQSGYRGWAAQNAQREEIWSCNLKIDITVSHSRGQSQHRFSGEVGNSWQASLFIFNQYILKQGCCWWFKNGIFNEMTLSNQYI